MKLQVVSDRDDGVRVLAVSGELDVTVAPGLLTGAQALVEGARVVVLDLTALSFFDSAGVRLVDELARACHRAGEGFRVVAPPASPSRRVLDLVGLADALASDDLEHAVAATDAARETG